MVSIFAKMIMKMLEKNKNHKFDLKDIEEFRATVDNMGLKSKPARGVNFEEIKIGNIPAEKYTLRSKDSKDAKPQVMLYLHGGGYIFGSYLAYRALVSKLCKKLNVNAYCINYRLAPEHPYPAALDDALFVYKWLLEEKSIPSENIIFMGDSAGGGLSLALLHRIGKQNLPQPKGAITMSPWTDLTLTSETLKTKADEDPFFNFHNIEVGAVAYRGSESPENPEISPMFSDFKEWPPVFIQVGTREMCLNDSLVIAEKMENQGAPVTLDVWEGMFHAFLFFGAIPIFGKLTPEFRQALKNIQTFVNSL